jgi:hypothetical protein
MDVGDESFTNLMTGEISIGESVFGKGPRAVRTAIAHEWGHYYNDIILDVVDIDPSLDGIELQTKIKPADHVRKRISSQIGDMSMSGYNNAMKNAGKFHIGLKWIKGGTKYYNSFTGKLAYRYFPYNELHWTKSFNFSKWYYLLPRRF